MIKIEKVGELYIIDENNKYFGVVSPDEILNYLVSHPEEMYKLVEKMKSTNQG